MISIVIPTFNTNEMTLTCCRAAQWGAGALAGEFIVVDDGSTEPFACENVEIVRLETNRGFAAAANAGVAKARGEIILLLNSDAIVERGAIDALIHAFVDDATLGVAGARLLNTDGTPQWSGGPIPTIPWLFVMVSGIARFIPKRNRGGRGDVGWVSGAAMAFRRDVWNAAGPLNEAYRFYAQDLEFCVRAREAGWNIRIVDDARVVHRGGATRAFDLEVLRSDLLAWGRAHYGRAWGVVAKFVMSAAAVLRRTR